MSWWSCSLARGMWALYGGTLGRVCKQFCFSYRESGHRVGQYDWDYSKTGMNFLSCGGFAPVAQVLILHPLLRSAIYMTLCLVPCGMMLMGPDCSSWTTIARGTSKRSVTNPWGDLRLAWVNGANLMVSRFLASSFFSVMCYLRVTLLLFLACASRSSFVIEQPAGSEQVFSRHHRFESFCNETCFVAWHVPMFSR